MGIPTQAAAVDVVAVSFSPGAMVSAYRIDSLVGTGGMGSVYRAHHTLTGRAAALKVLRGDQLAQDRAIDRMMREASILASVSNPGVPTFYECGALDDGRPWIAMEMAVGTPLSDRMSRWVLAPGEVIEIIDAVASVLEAVHARGVTHRDLKPENIVLCPDDARFPVRVIDWGIASQSTFVRLTNLNEAIGTPTYMAPEQARGAPTDGMCDVYGLGVVAYQALTGRPPFLGDTGIEILVQHIKRAVPPLARRCPDAPYGLVELVERMLAKRPTDRPGPAELRSVLARVRNVARGRAREQGVVDGRALAPTVEPQLSPVTAMIRGPRSVAS